LRNRNVFSRWRKTDREAEDRTWTSGGNQFQRIDAATWNERRPTVARRYVGTCSWCDDDDHHTSYIIIIIIIIIITSGLQHWGGGYKDDWTLIRHRSTTIRRRTTVESKSNRSCNDGLRVLSATRMQQSLERSILSRIGVKL